MLLHTLHFLPLNAGTILHTLQKSKWNLVDVFAYPAKL